MSHADTRAALAAAINTIDGLKGYAHRPTVFKAGDAWPQWRGGERADVGFVFSNTWVVIVVVPTDERTADEWSDVYGDDVCGALEPVMYVESQMPIEVPAEGGAMLALAFTGRSE